MSGTGKRGSGATNEIGAPASRIIVLTPRGLSSLRPGTWTRGRRSDCHFPPAGSRAQAGTARTQSAQQRPQGRLPLDHSPRPQVRCSLRAPRIRLRRPSVARSWTAQRAAEVEPSGVATTCPGQILGTCRHSMGFRSPARWRYGVRSGQLSGRAACRRGPDRWPVVPSIRPSLAGLRRWLRAQMTLLTGPASLHLEVLALRHQLAVVQEVRWRPRFGSSICASDDQISRFPRST